MEEIKVFGKTGASKIILDDSLNRLPYLIPKTPVFVITDDHVKVHWSKFFPNAPVFVMQAGESSKTIDAAIEICRWLTTQGADRSSFILGFGGGVVCDMTGFVASIYMRGINFGYVPTSLLAQIDAAIGGKTGVNLDGYKNMIGTFRQPAFVLIDPRTLNTLPDIEFRNGLAEAVKHCLIADRDMFFEMMQHAESILKRDRDLVKKLIKHSVQVKANIVNLDEQETGERRKLNLGHTWGHAVEKVLKIPHGQAVSVGLVFAANLSEQKGLLKKNERVEIIKLLKSLELPTKTPSQEKTIYESIIKDKKKEGDTIHFVFMKGIGQAEVIPIPVTELTSGIQ